MKAREINEKSLRSSVFTFQLLALFLVLIYETRNLSGTKPLFALLLIGLTYIANYIVKRFVKGDPYLFIIATFLLSIGTIMIFRLDSESGFKQINWILIGFVVYFLSYGFMKIIKKPERYTYIYFIIASLLFILTLLIGTEINGAKNWIIFGPISIQPTEIAKILLILFIASFYSRYDDFKDLEFRNFQIGEYLLLFSVYFLMAQAVLQKDMGTVMMFFSIFLALQYVYEKKRKTIFLNLLLAVVGGIFATLLFSHVRVRLVTWLNPWDYIDGMGYQITQSLFAIASGGFVGTGIGLGMPHTIPLAETDFIFAAICEEMGILAGMGIIMLFLLLCYRAFKIALEQNSIFNQILAIGLAIMFAAQSMIIIGGVLKIIPLTGITIPFVSYGGSSMLASFMAIGILQYLSGEANE